MRLATCRVDGERRIGVVEDQGFRDLTGPTGLRSLREMLESGSDGAVGGGDVVPLDAVTFDLPIHDPPRMLCVGINYMNRESEYGFAEAPEKPSLFMRVPQSFSAHEEAVLVPRESDQFDYEGEIVMVVGRKGRRISEADALGHVAGLSVMNEGTVRDWLRHGKFNVTQGKNFDRSGGFGPWIETDLSGLNVGDLRIETRVNGEVRQTDTTANMAFPFAYLIAYVSTFTTLMPGDVIATGTPLGAGARFDPPRWLKPGDVVEVEVEGVGLLRNPVEAEA